MSKTRKRDLFGIGFAQGEDLLKGVKKSDRPRMISSVAVMQNGKILMGKRRDTGKWTMPGGHLDEMEHPHSAARRELKEEAGIEAVDLHFMGSHELSDYKGKPLRIHAYRYDVPNEVATNPKEDPDQEVAKWEWIDCKNGVPEHVANNLHSPKNVTLKLLGLQNWDVEKAERKDFIPNTGLKKSIRDKLAFLRKSIEDAAKKIPEKIEAGQDLHHDEKTWLKHVTQPGHHVKVKALRGQVGKVIVGAKDPASTQGHDRMVLVEHEYNGGKIQRHYPAQDLSPHNESK